jgi:hypothetical protein
MSRSALIPSRSLFVSFAFLAGFALPVAAATDAHLVETYGKLSLQFEANQGQTDEDVRFLSRGAGYSLYLTATEAVLLLTQPSPDGKPNPDARRDGHDRQVLLETKARERIQGKSLALRMRLVGAAPAPNVSGRDALPGKANYFIGSDPAKWRTNVPTYAKVHYREVYPGIDLVYYGNQRQLEYDFVVAPGADPKKIVLGFKGAQKVEIDAQGDLVLHAAGGDLRQHKPVIYQEMDGVRTEIEGGYVLKGAKRVGFKLAAFDRNRPLIIDPVLSYSTYLGSATWDFGWGIASDILGNAYVTGIAGANFPTTAGAFKSAQQCFGFSGCYYAFVTKLDSSGTALYSTYLGSGQGFGIAVDATGNAHVTGLVLAGESANFPTTVGAFQPNFAGGDCGSGGYQRPCSDAFVTKLNPTGSALIYSTFLGGSGLDEGRGIATDAIGNAYVTGYTSSPNFPTTPGVFQTISGGNGDAFVTKLDPTGSILVYSTYLGGLGDNSGAGIAVDADGSAYVTGRTGANFPTTPGAFQPTSGGEWDAFVTKLNSDGSALVYSTFLGGCASDGGLGIAIDSLGNAHVTGQTSLTNLTCPGASNNFPTTVGAFQTTFGGGGSDAFVTKLNATGTELVYSTYLGGSSIDSGRGIAVDPDGNAYVTGGTRTNVEGWTSSTDFPTTVGAFPPSSNGGACVGDALYASSNAFVTKLNPAGSGLVYSTFLGGSAYDEGFGIAIDRDGNAYVTGTTSSNDFPTTSGAFQPTCGGSTYDAFVAKIVDSPDHAAPSTTATASPPANAAGWNNTAVTVALSATDNDGGSGVWSITYRINGDAPRTVSGATASFTLSLEGVNTITFNATDNAGNAEASKTVVVRIDKTPPSGTLSLSPQQLWPANHQLVTISPSLTVSDAGGGQVTVSGPLVSSSEPVTGVGDNTAPDWVVSGTTLQLRAERAESGTGRVYTVTYGLTDQAGNTAQVSSTVIVPKTR